MIPYRDNLVCEHPAYVTWTLIAVNIVIHLYTITLPYEVLNDLYYHYGMVPIRYTQPQWAEMTGLNPYNYFPWISCMFLHSNWLHLILNMWMLWIFGDNIEDKMGSVRFLVFYILCGLIAGAIHLLTNPDSPIATVGASGALAAVLGAYFVLFPYAKIVIWIPILFLPIFARIPAIAFLGFWVIIQIGQATAPSSGDNYAQVAWWAHLGGFVAGLVFYRLFLRPGAIADNQEQKP